MPPHREAPVAPLAVAVGGGLLFAGSLVGFVWNLRPGGSLAVDAGAWTSAGWRAIAADVALFTLFALHHSMFARLGLKAWVTHRLPAGLERPAYVWVSSVLFALTWWWWQPVPGRLWTVTGPAAAIASAVAWMGVVVTLVAAGRLSVFDLSGLTQVLDAHRPPAAQHDAPLVTGGLYGLVRHPIYLGWVLIVWGSPEMTGTRAAFAAISTAYLMAAIPFEERGLTAAFGPAYAAYRVRVRWRMLPFIY
ncbi:MAG: methyltransferase [Vicinamibacterales bacterium]